MRGTVAAVYWALRGEPQFEVGEEEDCREESALSPLFELIGYRCTGMRDVGNGSDNGMRRDL